MVLQSYATCIIEMAMKSPQMTYCIKLVNPLNRFGYITLRTAQKRWSLRACVLALLQQKGLGQGEVHGVTRRVLCTWWLLGLALKRPWLAQGGPPPTLTAWTGLENTTLTLQRAGFWQKKRLLRLSRCMATDSADYYMLVNEWVWSKSQDCLLRPKVDMSAVLESELGQKWR